MSITVFTKPKSILSIVVALVFIFDANLIMQLFGMSLAGINFMLSLLIIVYSFLTLFYEKN